MGVHAKNKPLKSVWSHFWMGEGNPHTGHHLHLSVHIHMICQTLYLGFKFCQSLVLLYPSLICPELPYMYQIFSALNIIDQHSLWQSWLCRPILVTPCLHKTMVSFYVFRNNSLRSLFSNQQGGYSPR